MTNYFSKLTNKKGYIPFWFILVTFPIPFVTAPMLAYNAATAARNRSR